MLNSSLLTGNMDIMNIMLDFDFLDQQLRIISRVISAHDDDVQPYPATLNCASIKDSCSPCSLLGISFERTVRIREHNYVYENDAMM